jgi:trans-2,3-dihydro-3-hydroxyanthranilate isomerase
MEIDIINCFCTEETSSGNPAAIVKNFIADSNEKQKLAKKLGMPVTVFVSHIKNENYNLEFFYPDTEMPLCLHGTMGAAYILLKDTALNNLVCITKSKSKLLIRNEGDIIQVLVSSDRVPEVIPNKLEICKMLNLKGINEIETEFPLTVSSVGSPKLLVPLISLESLARLKPNFDLIAQWSIKNQINGLYVYVKVSQDNTFDFYARGFNPKTGHNEDAATGVAAAALALFLKKSILVGQGAFIQRPSEINVSYDCPKNIWVGGRVCQRHCW